MALRDEMERQGNWLFRYRGSLPYLMLPLLFCALFYGDHLEALEAEPYETIWLIGCGITSLMGIMVRCLVIGYVPSDTSGRNTKAQRASQINTKGIYATVRHPLYFGNFLMILGVALITKVAWFIGLLCVLYFLYYERIMLAEEAFLRNKFGDSYDKWASVTPAFIPAFLRWTKPELPFSWRMILRREYPGVILMVALFALVDFVDEVIVEHEPIHEMTVQMFIMALPILLLVRLIKKKTSWLQTADR